jgi:hypothetical protein
VNKSFAKSFMNILADAAQDVKIQAILVIKFSNWGALIGGIYSTTD